jgi:hypothetical protein
MITITKGQKVIDYPQFIVVSPSGDYKEEDLIVCAEDDAPGKPFCMFQAQLVAYGNIVYSSNEPITPAQIADVVAEQERQAEANQPDQGSIIEAEPTPSVDEPTPPEELSPLPAEEPVPSMEIVAEEAPATQNMSTTTPATTTDPLPPAEPPATSTPAVSESPEAVNAEE